MNRRVTGALLAAVVVAGCSSTDGAGTSTPASGSSGAATGSSIAVYAAASLKASFTELAKKFEGDHPGSKVVLSFDGSSTLVTQITNGAQADVFASADQANMKKLLDAGLMADSPKPFAANTLQIAVAKGNPKKITGLADLAKPGVAVALCAAGVPCGSASTKALTAAGVTVKPLSEEQNVSAVVTKVGAGEVDAGLVYRTDVSASGGKIEGVDFPEAAQAVNVYPIGVLKAAPHAAEAQQFVDLVLSADGQKVLAGFGFAAP